MKATVRIALCGTCVVLGFTVTTFAADTGPSINSPDPQERIRAVQNVSDQAVLAKVVEEDKDWQVISTAAYLLTDQTLLVKLALNASTVSWVRPIVFEKLTDQATLAKVAAGESDGAVCHADVGHLTDQALLAKLAVEAKERGIAEAALYKLADQDLVAKIAADDVLASSAARQIVRVRRCLTDAAIQRPLGNTTLSIERHVISQDYEYSIQRALHATYHGPLKSIKYGEAVTFTVSGGRLTGKQTATWATVFPDKADSLAYQPAAVNIADLLTKLLEGLSQSELATLVLEDKEATVREAAVTKLTNQSVLAKIAEGDTDSDVRDAAVEKLTDQSSLAKLAVNCMSSHVGETAFGKLREQARLGGQRDQAVLVQVVAEREQVAARRSRFALLGFGVFSVLALLILGLGRTLSKRMS